jgi:DNA-directed RNA polymerase specialized sigma subunit
MGATKVDTHSKERALEESYPALNTSAGIKRLLADRNALLIRQYSGDYAAVDIVCDLTMAVDSAKLTERQSEAIRLVYEADLTQEEAARQAGVARSTLVGHVDDAVKKIAEIYEYWGWHGEGYTIETIIGEESE